MPGVIGLAFITVEAVKVSLEGSEWEAELYPSSKFDKFLKIDHGDCGTVALLSDKSYFQDALKLNVDRIIACCPWTWLQSRGIKTLDAEPINNGLTVNKNLHPAILFQELEGCEEYKRSVNDIWLSKGKPRSNPERDGMPVGKLYQTYSLANLLHIALHKADEDLLMVPPKDFWSATYRFAIGKMSKTDWAVRYGRSLKSAGVPRVDLQNITRWVSRYGKYLVAGKTTGAVSIADLKIATKLVK